MKPTNENEYLDRHGKPIDVYNYPESASREALRDYQHAVEVAHERDGLPVEGGPVSAFRWGQIASPLWAWDNGTRYRIAAPKIAKGHNPDGLTEEQVGINYGWRLLEPEEIAVRDNTPLIEGWDGTFWSNGHGIGYCGNSDRNTYRTKRPPGYFLPKKQETDEEAAERIWHETEIGEESFAVRFARKLLEWERSKNKS